VELIPPTSAVRVKDTHRLIRSRYPPRSVFAEISPAEDHDALADLEGWTNDRLQNDLEERVILPRSEWATGANASIVNAAFCHPHPAGGRFTSSVLGGWYAAFELTTAHREVAFHWWSEFTEVGAATGRVEARQYLADFNSTFHDVRDRRRHRALYDPESYAESQAFGARLRADSSNGIVYDSVRHLGHDCLVAFRPKLVRRVRQGAHFEYVWSGGTVPSIRKVPRATK